MRKQQRNEIVNAARSYERVYIEREEIFHNICRLMREGDKSEAKEEIKRHRECKSRVSKVEKLLAERIYGPHDFIRVDNVIYRAYSNETILRVPIDSIPDLGRENDDTGD